jgi:hypothetical protein
MRAPRARVGQEIHDESLALGVERQYVRLAVLGMLARPGDYGALEVNGELALRAPEPRAEPSQGRPLRAVTQVVIRKLAG